MELDKLLIYYDDNTNIFTDEYGNTEDSVVDIMTYDDMLHYKKVGGTCYHDLGGVTYIIDFPVRDNNRVLYYDVAENYIYDEKGCIVFNIFSIITPNDLFIFKYKKETMMFDTLSGGAVELQYCTEPIYADI